MFKQYLAAPLAAPLVCAVAVLSLAASALASAPASAAELKVPIATTSDPPKVSVLDGGDVVVVEAHEATIGEVIDAMRSRLKLTFSNTERVDLTAVVDGSRSGTISHILSWLIPNGGFVISYQDSRPGTIRRPAEITFLPGGNPSVGNAVETAAAPPVPQGQTSPSPAAGRPSGQLNVAGGPRRGGNATGTGSSGDTAAKPDVPDTGGQPEYHNVAQQLQAATANAQLEIERQAHDETGSAPAPRFLGGPENAANTSIEQQMQRAQALATNQLRALQDAFSAACRGRGVC